MGPLMLALLLGAALAVHGDATVLGGIAALRRASRVAGILLLAALVMGAAALY